MGGAFFMGKNNNMVTRIIMYLLGLFVMTMGIAISVKSNLGVSPVSSIPYTMTCVWGIEMGRATILFHIGLVIIQILLLRKAFKIKNLLQVPVGVLFGMFTTACNSLMTYFPDVNNIWIQLSMTLVSAFLIAFGIFIYVPADIIPLAGEGCMLAVSKVTKIKFSTVKIAFDISMVAISLITCLVVIKQMGSVGLGTLVAAFLVGLMLKAITRVLGRYRDIILDVSEARESDTISPLLEIMKEDVYTVGPDSTLLDALKLMREKKISGLPVVDDDNKLLSFISDGDIMRYLSREHSLFVNSDSIEKISFNDKVKEFTTKKVSEIGAKSIISVNSTDSLDKVCYVLAEYHIKKAPVMKDGNMIGIINASNITKYALKLIEE